MNEIHRDDRSVRIKGHYLQNKRIDFVVTGGIAAIEAPKQIRELRRYGAEVRVWMTPAAKNFVTPLVFEWASGNPVITDLSGTAEHISTSDAVVVAPTTLNFLSKVSLGIADSAASTLVQSALGRTPLFFVPTMHLSLREGTAYERHRSALSRQNLVSFLDGPTEEGKQKTVGPKDLAALVCYQINRKPQLAPVLVTLGSTRSYWDRVRFLSNASSGTTGLKIADAFFRSGLSVQLLSGKIDRQIPFYLEAIKVKTNEEMMRSFDLCLKEFAPSAIIHTAAILDFEFTKTRPGKTTSDRTVNMWLQPTPKIIDLWKTQNAFKVGFKLESGLSKDDFKNRLREWNQSKGADLVVGNLIEELSPRFQPRLIYSASSGKFFETEANTDLAELLVREYLQGRRSSSTTIKTEEQYRTQTHCSPVHQ